MASNQTASPPLPQAPPPPIEDDSDDDDQAEEAPRPRSNGRRLFGVASSLLRIHYEIAEREAAADQKRLVRGVVFLGVSFFLLLLTLLVAQALLVFGLGAAGLSLLAALGVTAGVDALGGLLCLLLGRWSLKAPVLPQTRALLRRTMAALVDP